MIDFSKIKLVIWDLDDTFWSGTLSEGGVTPIARNLELIRSLTDIGVVNAVCSKNNRETAEAQLQAYDVLDYFVFNSINWEPKGQRISAIIKDMGLRATNTLFIDDNTQNLNEASFYEPQLMVGTPEDIGALYQYVKNQPAKDPNHNRLKQYKVLEEKRNAREQYSDNRDFLYSTQTKVVIHKDCMTVIDRIYELIQRTNQLNYTKNRCSMEELKDCINNSDCECGYVTVSDRFGDYGIVGFYALQHAHLEHFLFSCRTIGQGVEQYVYAALGYPSLDVVGEVVNAVTNAPMPDWINREDTVDLQRKDDRVYSTGKKILIKGACDLDIMASFLSSPSIITEFAYVGEKHNRIEHHNHSVNILQWHSINQTEKDVLLQDLPFNDVNMFDTHLFDEDIALVIISTQIEPNLGIYKSKKNGQRIAFGEWCYPLTDPDNWEGYINDTIPNYGNEFTKEWLVRFAEEWEFEGQITLDEYEANIRKLLTLINKEAKICLLLGSEIPFEANNQKAYVNRHLVYQSYNERFRKLSEEEPRILILDFSKFIHGQEDFLDNINHYQRRIYYEASQEARKLIQGSIGLSVKRQSVIALWIDELAIWFRNHLNRNSRLFACFKAVYRSLRKK